MNIFYLDNNPMVCAQMHCDKHVVKMILESCQLLSTAHRVLDNELPSHLDGALYKSTHKNHPSAIWVRNSKTNYHWLCDLTIELCFEYTHRYGKIHKAQRDNLVELLWYNTPKNIIDAPFTEPTPAMPDDVKVNDDSITSYRNYYIQHKQHLAKWTNRPVPQWFTVENEIASV